MSKDKRSDWFGTSFLLFRAAPVAFWSIGGNTLKPNRSNFYTKPFPKVPFTGLPGSNQNSFDIYSNYAQLLRRLSFEKYNFSSR